MIFCKQAELVRSLKSSGTALKEEIEAEVQKLLKIKQELGITNKSKKNKKKGK